MAAPSTAKIIRCGVEVIQSPSNLAAARPYGGTYLGSAKGVAWRTTERGFDVVGSEYQEVIEVLQGGGNWVVGCRMRSLDDDDMKGAVFWNTSTGSSSGEKVIDHPGTIRAGYTLSGRGSTILFAAKDVSHQSLILYNAVPLWEESEAIRLSQISEASVPIIWLGLRDGSGRIGKFGLLEDLSL